MEGKSLPTAIEWTHRPGTTGETWQVVTGCKVLSAGCRNCYAMRLAGGRLKNHPTRQGLTRPTKAGPVWNGLVRFNAGLLDQPLRWRDPRTVFVAAHGDLFYEGVAAAVIDRVFAIMALSPRHTFLVLTKRSARLRDYMTGDRFEMAGEHFGTYEAVYNAMGQLGRDGLVEPHPYRRAFPNGMPWPLPNVWLGVSVENQETAEARIPDLLRAPAARRWVSAEPLLEYIALGPYLGGLTDAPGLDWVVAGGESDQNKPGRIVDAEAFRWLARQCRLAHVPYFQKQMPRKAPIPVDLRVREWPDG